MVVPQNLEWTDVEEAADMPEEPPSSEVNVDLVADVDEDIIIGSGDLDQGTFSLPRCSLKRDFR